MATKRLEPLADVHGMIARIRSRLPVNCGVALSPYCDHIIAMRMQGIAYRQIENWLIAQGDEYRLAAPTIWKNLARAKIVVQLPYAEELAERWGGAIDLDLVRELSGQVVAQRLRVDALQRREAEQQKLNSNYYDKRIKGERETLAAMIKDLHGMLKSPLQAAEEKSAADLKAGENKVDLTDDAKDLVTHLLLTGEIKVGSLD